MDKPKRFLLVLPSLTVFLSSACIMIIELVASRLIARHLGSSLYTWTSVIGVVLAGITIGNYLGGRIADKYKPHKALSALFCMASVACVIIVILNNIVGEWIWLWQLSWPMRVFSHITLVFLLPSILLGTISPVVAKMALDRGLPSGRTVGDIYACGAAGSIAGTFIAGFYLIAAMGTISIIWTVAFVLLVIALIYHIKSWPVYVWAIILLVFFFLSSADAQAAHHLGTQLLLREKPNLNVLYEDETQYCYVAVEKIDNNPNHLSFLQDKLRHSEIRLDDPERLQYFYTKIYAAVTDSLFLTKKNASFMVIGGGGYVYPRYLEKYWPDGRVDVVEIDPGVTEGAMAAFGLSRDTKINTYSMDARNYVDDLIRQKNKGLEIPRYDCIYEDAINDYSVPFQLVTKEFNEKISQILNDDGVYMVNLIDMYDPGLFLGGMVNTLKETFPYLSIATEPGMSKADRTTFVIVCSKKPIDLKMLIQKFEVENHAKLEPWYLSESEVQELESDLRRLVFSDDYAPVENLLAPVVKRSAKDFLASKYMKIASDLKKENHYNDSIQYYQKAAEALNRFTFKAYNEIGTIYAAQQRWEDAIAAFRVAIDFSKTTAMKANIGSIYFNSGVILMQLNRPQEAKEQIEKSIEAFKVEIRDDPSFTAYSYMGNAYATLGDFASASEAFSNAIKINPTDAESYDSLAKTLEYQGRYDEAIAVCEKLIELGNHFGKETTPVQKYIDYLRQLKQKAEQTSP